MNKLIFDPADLEQYRLQASVADFDAEMAAYKHASERARAALSNCFCTHAYGDDPAEKLDVYAARHAGAPVYLFIHGGYWRMLSKDDSAMMAQSLHAAGATVICLDYGLAPAYRLPQIVAQCERALQWVHAHARQFNGDPQRIHISGSSAGGHLSGMLLAADAQREQRLIHSASILSGVMDLHPILQTAVNDWLQLDEEQAQRYSPALHPPAQGTPVLVAWGALEPAVMHEQSRHYARQCELAGCVVRSMSVPNRHHFNVLMDLEQSDSALTLAVLQTMNRHTQEERL